MSTHQAGISRYLFRALCGVLPGAFVGFLLGIALSFWHFAGSGVALAWGGDGGDVVVFGLAMFGFLGAMAGGTFGGFTASKTSVDEATRPAKKPLPEKWLD